MTDEEWNFAEVQALEETEYSSAVYTALLLVMDTREAVSEDRARLRYYLLAKGASLGETPTDDSQIYLGSALCD